MSLDVSVFDQDHHPVKRLTVGEFAVLEDNKPRAVVTFSEIDIPIPPVPSAAWLRDAAVDVTSNDAQDRRLFMLVVDDANLAHREVDQARQIARSVIDQLWPSDLAAIVFTGDNRHAEDFTTDHARLLTAVSRMTDTQMSPDLRSVYAIDVVRRATEYLIGLPGRRKALIDITEFNMGMAEAISPARDPRRVDPGTLIDLTRQIFVGAQRANVNVHLIPPGLSDRGILALQGNWEANWVTRVPHETGGELIPGKGDQTTIAEGVARIFAANSSYYMLGYSSADVKKFHTVKVTVNHPGAEVHARDKYYWPQEEKPVVGPAPPPLLKAMAGVLPRSDLPMRASVLPFAVSGQPGATVAVVVKVRAPADGGARTADDVELQTRAFTVEGEPRGTMLAQTMPLARAAGTTGGLEGEALSSLALKPGRYELRIAGHRAVSGMDGSVYVTVEVPDFAKARVSLSGVVVSTATWPPLGPREALASLLPAVPTTEREFAKGDRAMAFVRVYEGGKNALTPVPVHVRIVDDHNRAVLDRTETLPVNRFGTTRGADLKVDLPTGTLAPGPYLLTFGVTLGKTTASRDVRFSIR